MSNQTQRKSIDALLDEIEAACGNMRKALDKNEVRSGCEMVMRPFYKCNVSKRCDFWKESIISDVCIHRHLFDGCCTCPRAIEVAKLWTAARVAE